MSKKTWIIFAVVCVVALGGLIFLSKKGQADVSNIDQNKILSASSASGNIADHVLDNPSGKTTLIEYGDYECPACKAAYPNIKAITDQFKDQLTFVFRNNPLTSIHPNARAGAAAAEAAGLQGKYWQMHDALYENQDEWGSSSSDQRTNFFVKYAQTVGVKDINKFKTDMASSQVDSKINLDLALGKKIPVTGTPTLVLNGKQIDSTTWNNLDALTKRVQDALK